MTRTDEQVKKYSWLSLLPVPRCSTPCLSWNTSHASNYTTVIHRESAADPPRVPSACSCTDLSRPVGKISMDDRSGDFVEHSGPIDINLRTLFHFRKALPPRLDPCSHRKAIPPQPLPVNYSTMGWLWGTGPISGVQLDALGECGFAILTFSSSLLARLRRHRWDHGVERPHNPTVFLTLSCR